MSHSEHSDVEIQNLLDIITHQMVSEQCDIEAVLHDFEGQQDAIRPYAALVSRLHECLTPQTPSATFTRDLKRDLMGQQHNSRHPLMYLPLRAQIAAALAAVAAGFLLMLRRRSAETRDSIEVPALQQ